MIARGNRGARDRGPPSFPVTTFLSHGRERCATRSGVIDTACDRTLAGTCWFQEFEVELKRHATTVEVVPGSERIRFGLGAVKKSSPAIIFPVAVGQTVFLLRASLLDEEVPFVGQPTSSIPSSCTNPFEHGRATDSTTWRTFRCGCKRRPSCCCGEK